MQKEKDLRQKIDELETGMEELDEQLELANVNKKSAENDRAAKDEFVEKMKIKLIKAR